MVRALASHARGHRFESCTAHHRIEEGLRKAKGGTRAEVAERKTRYVQGVVPLVGVWVQIPPSAPVAITC